MAVVKRRPVPRTVDVTDGENTGAITCKLKEEYTNSDEPRERRPCPRTSDLKSKQNEVEGKEDVVTMNNSEPQQRNYNLDMFQPSATQIVSRGNLKLGAMTVVNSKCGKRITISKEVMNKLNNTSNIAISFSDERIAVGEYLPNNNNQITLKMVGKKGVIYSAGLVTEITEKYQLDFTNRTSITFSEIDYIEDEGATIAIISPIKEA